MDIIGGRKGSDEVVGKGAQCSLLLGSIPNTNLKIPSLVHGYAERKNVMM